MSAAMAEGSTSALDKTLEPDSAADILEELLDAQNHSHVLGLKLKLKFRDVEAIFATYAHPKDRLLRIIIAFLNQVEPRPTWKVIVDALKSPAVDLPVLAKKVEEAHGTVTSHPTSADIAVTGQDFPSFDEALSAVVPATSSHEVQLMITELDKRFDALKNNVRECLEKHGISVERVADALTSLSADDDEHHKIFLESHVHVLFKAVKHSELFGTMNFHWNYLNCPLLDHLVRKFELKEVKLEMEAYKSSLQQFREKTPLTLFCRTQKRRHLDPPPSFRTVVAFFNWPENQNEVTLEVVEQFRQEYASHYNLRDCAMMVATVRPGSFIVTWFVPLCIVEKMKAKIPRKILDIYSVTKLEIDGACVYRLRQPLEINPLKADISANGAPLGATEDNDPKNVEHHFSLPEEEYSFVEEPPDDCFCPVMACFLLEPHLTSCCGKHLSQVAASRIQGGGGVCPLCNSPCWTTMLNKHFQRQINSLHVFCRHEKRGCLWQGELAALDRHTQICSMKDAPILVDLYDQFQETKESDPARTSHQLKLQCHRKKTAPCGMMRGSVTTDGHYIYVSSAGSNSVYSFELNEDRWEKLPPCPFCNSGLIIIDGALTAVGGEDVSSFTNKLHTLRGIQWTKSYRPMKTARASPAVVSTSDGNYIAVIGGHCGSGRMASVELLRVKGRRWYKLADLPQPLLSPSASISGNLVYVIGNDSKGYWCSLEALPTGEKPIASQSIPHLITWTPLPPLPVIESTITSLSRQIMLIGGVCNKTPVSSIHQLMDGEWVDIGSTSSSRRSCLVANPRPREMIVAVGGVGTPVSVEECVLLPSTL